jgi:GNAT superfamily N-acetyltransferase
MAIIRAIMELRKDSFLLSDDRSRLDLDAIWDFIHAAYWATARTREQHDRALAHSLCVGLYDEAAGGAQIGFARAVTDYAITAHIADVYILETHRGRGLSKWLMQAILDHPELAMARRFTLNTDDAHGLYAQFGFKPLRKPEAMMELWRGPAW